MDLSGNTALLIDDRAAWLEARRQCLTATDIAAICGLTPYGSPRTVYLDKRGELLEKDMSPAMEFGTRIEPMIAQWFADHKGLTMGVDVIKADFVLDPTCPQFGATCDYYVGDDAVLECKYAGPNAAKAFGIEGSDAVPEHYLTQVQWQMMVTGRKFGYLVVCTPPEFRLYEIVRNDVLIGRLRHQGKQFWDQHIALGVPPELTGVHADCDLVDSIPANKEADVCAATESIDDMAALLEDVAASLKALTVKRDTLVNRIKAFMAESTVMTTTIGSFTWREQSKESVSLKDLPADFRAQIDPYVKRSTFRVFKTPFKTEG